jgi:serine/threonine-protein kinase
MLSACLSEDAVVGFMRGQSVGAARREVEAHLASCGECRALVSELARGSASAALGMVSSGARLARESPALAPTVPSSSSGPSPLLPVQPGQTIGGKYEVEWTIGAGGMGVVVAAVHKVLGQRVAIKFPVPALRRASEGRERLIREARACAQLRSEYAVRLLDVGTLDDGSPYVVMEYLVGRTLAERLLEEAPLPRAEAIDSLVEACEALGEAHAKGIVHRDLKPSNLFETHRFDGSRVIKVLDFGIAKYRAHAGEDALTVTREVMGSPAYMAPEQLRSTRDVDARADIWALGVTLRELLTGKLDDARVEPPALERVVLKCLELDPARRYATVEDLAKALAPFGSNVAQGIASRLASSTRTVAHSSRRRTTAVLGLAGMAAAAVAVAWMIATPSRLGGATTPAAAATVVRPAAPVPTEVPATTPLTPSAEMPSNAAPSAPSPPPGATGVILPVSGGPVPTASARARPADRVVDPHGLLDRK